MYMSAGTPCSYHAQVPPVSLPFPKCQQIAWLIPQTPPTQFQLVEPLHVLVNDLVTA